MEQQVHDTVVSLLTAYLEEKETFGIERANYPEIGKVLNANNLSYKACGYSKMAFFMQNFADDFNLCCDDSGTTPVSYITLKESTIQPSVTPSVVQSVPQPEGFLEPLVLQEDGLPVVGTDLYRWAYVAANYINELARQGDFQGYNIHQRAAAATNYLKERFVCCCSDHQVQFGTYEGLQYCIFPLEKQDQIGRDMYAFFVENHVPEKQPWLFQGPAVAGVGTAGPVLAGAFNLYPAPGTVSSDECVLALTSEIREQAADMLIGFLTSQKQKGLDLVHMAAVGNYLADNGIPYRRFGNGRLSSFLQEFSQLIEIVPDPDGTANLFFVGLLESAVTPPTVAPETTVVPETTEPPVAYYAPVTPVASSQTWVMPAPGTGLTDWSGVSDGYLQNFRTRMDETWWSESENPIASIRASLTKDFEEACLDGTLMYQEVKEKKYVVLPTSILDQFGTPIYALFVENSKVGQKPWWFKTPFVPGESSYYGREISDAFGLAVAYAKEPREGLELFNWAYIPPNALQKLADIALPERWDYGTAAPGETPRMVILDKYFKHTFGRQCKEGNVLLATDTNGDEYAAFDTGLVDRSYEPIYALFVKNTMPNQQYWFFDSAVTAGRGRGKYMTKLFNPLPKRADYFEGKIENMLYDPNRKLFVSDDHIILDRTFRLPRTFLKEMCSDAFLTIDGVTLDDVYDRSEADPEKVAYFKALREKLDDYENTLVYNRMKVSIENAIDFAVKRATWNFRTAIPTYYPRQKKGALLLPLVLVESHKSDVTNVDVALVVELTDAGNYQGQTILPLTWAYSNSRLVARPDSDWLNTSGNILDASQDMEEGIEL